MPATPATEQYWLFQSNPKVFRLREALRQGALESFAVKSHQKRIRPGDRVILWQTGRDAGCYALCTVDSEVAGLEISEEERAYFLEALPSGPRVRLRVDYNLWNRPLTKDILPDHRSFQRFYAGLPGTNYKASKKQYDELAALVAQLDVVNEPQEEYAVRKKQRHPLNFILYGPPGTGKTYATVNYALSIIEDRPLSELALEERHELRKRFENYREENQIHLVSFHQSFTYEDFVEGIRPHTNLLQQVVYELEDGIFKIACQEARRCVVEALMRHLQEEAIKIDFEPLFKAFLEHLRSEAFRGFQTATGRKVFLQKILRFGNISVRPDKSFSTYTILKNRLRQLYRNFEPPGRDVDQDQNIRNLIGAGVNARAYYAVYSYLKQFENQYIEQLTEEKEELGIQDEAIKVIDFNKLSQQLIDECNKHVLIIDEINRGNIASIFGELITLIDPDKREGASEALQVVLPYSKSEFSVPPNLYILGTMNTADRSIETLDLALRRRFSFLEMPPRPDLIGQLTRNPIPDGVDLEKLLVAMNRRIEVLLDRNYRIGHAYFLKVETLDDLKELFGNRILPLLQEYFFGDPAKIGMILGKAFLQELNYEKEDIFADLDPGITQDMTEKRIFGIRPVAELEARDFIRVYEKKS